MTGDKVKGISGRAQAFRFSILFLICGAVSRAQNFTDVKPSPQQVVAQFEIKEEASQTRDCRAATNAAFRAARSDPSLRKRGLLRMTNSK
jgi:hypothetical protein